MNHDGSMAKEQMDRIAQNLMQDLLREKIVQNTRDKSGSLYPEPNDQLSFHATEARLAAMEETK